MKTLWTQLPTFLRTTSWRTATCVSLIFPMTGVYLTGCVDGQNVAVSQSQALQQNDNVTFKPLATIYDHNHGINEGQKNALIHFIAKRWQIKSINHIPVAHDIIVDLSEFSSNKGYAYTDCDKIFFELDTQKIMNGGLSVINIERQMNNCSHNVGDDIMRLFGDLHSFYHQDGTLTLLSLKDKIELVPSKS